MTAVETREELSLADLADLPAGTEAVVVAVDRQDPTGRRLADLGLLPRTHVRLLRRAPLGDPAVYALRGYRLCLRREDARRVRVYLANDAERRGA